jgi:hypothetical protein
LHPRPDDEAQPVEQLALVVAALGRLHGQLRSGWARRMLTRRRSRRSGTGAVRSLRPTSVPVTQESA